MTWNESLVSCLVDISEYVLHLDKKYPDVLKKSEKQSLYEKYTIWKLKQLENTQRRPEHDP